MTDASRSCTIGVVTSDTEVTYGLPHAQSECSEMRNFLNIRTALRFGVVWLLGFTLFVDPGIAQTRFQKGDAPGHQGSFQKFIDDRMLLLDCSPLSRKEQAKEKAILQALDAKICKEPEYATSVSPLVAYERMRRDIEHQISKGPEYLESMANALDFSTYVESMLSDEIESASTLAMGFDWFKLVVEVDHSDGTGLRKEVIGYYNGREQLFQTDDPTKDPSPGFEDNPLTTKLVAASRSGNRLTNTSTGNHFTWASYAGSCLPKDASLRSHW